MPQRLRPSNDGVEERHMQSLCEEFPFTAAETHVNGCGKIETECGRCKANFLREEGRQHEAECPMARFALQLRPASSAEGNWSPSAGRLPQPNWAMSIPVWAVVRKVSRTLIAFGNAVLKPIICAPLAASLQRGFLNEPLPLLPPTSPHPLPPVIGQKPLQTQKRELTWINLVSPGCWFPPTPFPVGPLWPDAQ